MQVHSNTFSPRHKLIKKIFFAHSLFAEAEAADVQQQQVPSAYEFSSALDFPLEPAPAAEEEDEATKATKACFWGPG